MKADRCENHSGVTGEPLASRVRDAGGWAAYPTVGSLTEGLLPCEVLSCPDLGKDVNARGLYSYSQDLAEA